MPLALLLAALAAAAPARAAARPPADEAAAARAAIVTDREQDARFLRTGPTSYLRAVARVDFGNKTALTVGSGPSDDVKLEGLDERQLVVTASSAAFDVKGARFARRGSKVTVGRYTLALSHQGYPAVIVFDPRSPRVAQYHGLSYFPIDLSYRYVARLIPDPKAETLAIQSTHSADRRAARLGWFEFEVGGKRRRLAATRMLEPGASPDSLIVLFRDATTGKESYKVGRYALPVKRPDGSYLLDFNMAFNPACAYSTFYNCPIPPKENALDVAIRAGAKDPHYH
jgi:hypothetical protein